VSPPARQKGQEESSFLKKRSKKLLLMASGVSFDAEALMLPR
jgi:hypothetical protein